MNLVLLKEKIRVIPDFPSQGISFKDITTLLRDKEAFHYAIKELAKKCAAKEIDLVVAPEARGFLIGAVLAYELGVGFVPVRKRGKLPSAVYRREYQLEYGSDALEMHQDAVRPGQKVLAVDDLLATGGTINSVIHLVEQSGGEVSAAAFLIELTYLPGREQLKKIEVISLLQY